MIVRSYRPHVFVVFAFALSLVAVANGPAFAGDAERLSAIAANDNRVAAGRLSGSLLSLALDATTGRWYPDGPGRPSIAIEAFAERGHAPLVPGPLVRVVVGTDVRIRIRNTIVGSTLVVHNLVDLPSKIDRPISVPSGTERIVRIHTYAPGTFYYWATTTGRPFADRFGADSLLSGAIVIDPARVVRDDRIFVIANWDNVRNPSGRINRAYELLSINGRAWPATERLSYPQGANVRWHLINTTGDSHPMHLHGFPFAMLERGDGTSVREITGEREVTERVDGGMTSSFQWTATRPGAWMFHCHLAYHIISHQPTSVMLAGKPTLDFVTSQKRAMSAGMDMDDMMGGLVLSVNIRRDPKLALARDIVPLRHLRLDVAPKPGPTDPPDAKAIPALEYVLSEGDRTVPSSGAGAPPIVLVRGVPVGIDIHNHLDEATTVHWHGIEMQDPYYDGPVGFLNARERSAPMILPDGRFEARFVPTRAGTFIYHSHMDDVWQVAGGLAGPLIVLEPGATFDPTNDHIVMLTTPRDSKYWGSGIDVNGALETKPIEMVAGMLQRLRLINLTTFDSDIVVRMTATDAPQLAWQLRARDGMDLARKLPAPRDVAVTIGSTRDLEFLAPRSGNYSLEILPDADSPAYAKIPIRIVERVAASVARERP